MTRRFLRARKHLPDGSLGPEIVIERAEDVVDTEGMRAAADDFTRHPTPTVYEMITDADLERIAPPVRSTHDER